MTHLVHLLMALILIQFIIRQSMQRLPVNIAFALLSGLSLILLQSVIANQSKTHLEWVLTNPEVMTTLALLVVFECAIVLAWCFANPSCNGKKAFFVRFLEWFPGVTVFPVLWYILATVIFEMPGRSFNELTLIMASIVFGLLTALPALIRYALPEANMRKELLFMMSILLVLLSAIAPVQGMPVFSTTQDPQWLSLLVFAGVSSVLFGAGILLSRMKKSNLQFPNKMLHQKRKALQQRKAA